MNITMINLLYFSFGFLLGIISILIGFYVFFYHQIKEFFNKIGFFGEIQNSLNSLNNFPFMMEQPFFDNIKALNEKNKKAKRNNFS